jgi:hypothetical protein
MDKRRGPSDVDWSVISLAGTRNPVHLACNGTLDLGGHAFDSLELPTMPKMSTVVKNVRVGKQCHDDPNALYDSDTS